MDPAHRLHEIKAQLRSGHEAPALAHLEGLVAQTRDARVLQDVGEMYSHLNRHVEAEAVYGRAAAIAPRDPRALYNWATCLIALGRLDDAERLLTRVIELNPGDHDAYYNRSTLRRQTAERHHVAELKAALSRPGLAPPARVALGYALAKELEDLGRYEESFAALAQAAGHRKRQLSYAVDGDVAALHEIAQAFGAGYCGAEARSDTPGFTEARPIFIVGLPRSGTTLVDRILSSHSAVQSRGESSVLATAVTRAAMAAVTAGPGAGAATTPAVGSHARVGEAAPPDKLELIRWAARADVLAPARDYCARLPVPAGVRIIDKTPLNFLYLGLIARALPNACVVHVRRGAMDVCYAMYKTLFRMAYPFSYDLEDLGQYYMAYARLMAHWRDVVGERLIEIDYEALVADQERETRRLVAACGLSWEDGCLEFQNNQSPSLTASAAQVRRPIYSSSVGLWRRYEAQLQPLVETLRAGGVMV